MWSLGRWPSGMGYYSHRRSPREHSQSPFPSEVRGYHAGSQGVYLHQTPNLFIRLLASRTTRKGSFYNYVKNFRCFSSCFIVTAIGAWTDLAEEIVSILGNLNTLKLRTHSIVEER